MTRCQSSLTELVRGYRAGSVSWDRLVAQVVPVIHRILARIFHAPYESRCEVISEFYPRMGRVVDEYRDVGTTFEGYLARCVTNCYRSYWRRNRKREEFEVPFAEEHDYPELDTSEHSDLRDLDRQTRAAERPLAVDSRTRDAVRRQVLFVLCQNAPLLSDAECDRYAELFDVPTGYISSLFDFVQQRNVDRTARRTTYRERRDRHYAAMVRCERLAYESEDPVERRRHETRARRHREQWDYYRHRLSRQTIALTHRDVAELFGVPKGSVDSSLSYLQTRLERLVRER